MEVLQNDWGFGFALSSNASIYGKNKIYEILTLPAYRRLYQGNLLDMINSTARGRLTPTRPTSTTRIPPSPRPGPSRGW